MEEVVVNGEVNVKSERKGKREERREESGKEDEAVKRTGTKTRRGFSSKDRHKASNLTGGGEVVVNSRAFQGGSQKLSCRLARSRKRTGRIKV